MSTSKKHPGKAPVNMKPKFEEDGITHINIDYRGNSELGRLLHQFTPAPFTHPHFGKFASVEGFWQYIRSVERDDRLRKLSGIVAFKHGQKAKEYRDMNYCEVLDMANYYKIDQNPKIKKLMIKSTLPFECYYTQGEGNIVTLPVNRARVIDCFTKLRKNFVEGIVPVAPDYKPFE